MHPLGLLLSMGAGWLLGLRAGALCGLVTAVLNISLVDLLPIPLNDRLAYFTRVVMEAPFFAMAGGLTGHWRRTRDQLCDEIRERQRAQRALARNAAHETALLGALPDLFFVLSRDGTFLDAHAPSSEHLILPPEEFLGLRVDEVFPGPLAQQFRAHLSRALETGRPESYEYQLERVPEARRDFEARLVIVADQDEVLLLVRDITDRKLAETERMRLAAVVESSERLVAIADLDRRVEFLNDAGRRLLGVPPGAPLALSLRELPIDPGDTGLESAIAGALSGEVVSLACVLADGHGQPRMTEGSLLLLREHGSGQPSRIALILEDRTERLQLEAGMARSNRMASIGLLAAGVAHEINNPLTYVLYNLMELSEALGSAGAIDPAERADLAALASDAVTGARRVRDIVKDLKTFSRLDDATPRRVALRRVLELALNLSRSHLQRRARLVLEIEGEPAVRGTEARLVQAVLSLLINADQAVADQPPSEDDAESVITVRAWTEGGEARVEVRDTGVGIPERDLPRIFDPFFTTRPVGSGSGLGLSICHNVITAFGGRIAVESDVGGEGRPSGSSFTLCLPMDRSEPAGPEARSRAPTRRGRVLIIDDEPLVARALVRRLQAAHDVAVATSGEQARAMLERGGYDAVISDLMMPDTTGMALHDWLSARNPAAAARVIFMSGGVYSQEARAFIKRLDAPVLPKPIDIDLLLERIAALIVPEPDQTGL